LGEDELSGSEVSTSVVKWSRCLSNRVYIIIKRYIDHMRCVAYMAVRFTVFFYNLFVLFYNIVRTETVAQSRTIAGLCVLFKA